MITPIRFLLVATALAALPVSAAEPVHAMLTYTMPTDDWSGGALPIGNGRMGAMLFGGVGVERIQFNEQSLWSGDNNWDGGYDCGDHGFGSYLNFGDLIVQWSAGDPEVTSPSGHQNGDGKGISNTIDGKADTKWCVDSPGKLVVWQVRLPAAQVVKSYTLTAAQEKSYDSLRAAHVKDLGGLLERVRLDVGATDPAVLARANARASCCAAC